MWEKVEHGVAEVFREAKAPDLAALPAESLEALSASAREAREGLAQEVLERGKAQKAAAERGDWAAFEAHREQVQRQREEWDSLGDSIAAIQEVLLRKRLDEKVFSRLGSRRRAVALEATVLGLIVLVIAILVWEPLYMDRLLEQYGEAGTARILLWLAAFDTAICLFFLWEFFWKMSLAESRSWYFRHHWIDFVSSLPFALLHLGVLRIGRVARVMRAVRLVRMVRVMRLLRAVRAIAFVFRGFDKVGQSFNVRVLNRPLAATAVFLLIGGVIMGMVEGDAFANYGSPMRGGIWWSFATVCTGGFADIHDPNTDVGRVLTVVLVILGAILTGAFTAALASVLLGDDTERIERKLGAVLERLPRKGGDASGTGR